MSFNGAYFWAVSNPQELRIKLENASQPAFMS